MSSDFCHFLDTLIVRVTVHAWLRPLCRVADRFNAIELNIPPTQYKKASIRCQDSAPPISGYWPTSEPNAG